MNSNKQAIRLYVTVTRDFDKIDYRLHYDSDSKFLQEQKEITKDLLNNIEQECFEMIDQLNSDIDNILKDERLKTTGIYICEQLLTTRLKDHFNVTKAEYLILYIDKALVNIPWELLYISQETMVCEKFFVGRLINHEAIKRSEERSINSELNMLIVTPDGNLSHAIPESDEICSKADSFNNSYSHLDLSAESDSQITAHNITYKIKNYDFVHFVGHAEFNNEISENGWILKPDPVYDNDNGNTNDKKNEYSILTSKKIEKMAGGTPMPLLVFSNACQSARTKTQLSNQEANFGLVYAFIGTGVKHYIGTYWDITDEAAHFFAVSFYHYLFSGYSIGESIYEARKIVLEKNKCFCWASYQLYGDPQVIYFNDRPQNEPIKKPQPPKKDHFKNEKVEQKPTRTIKEFLQKLKVNSQQITSKNWITTILLMTIIFCIMIFSFKLLGLFNRYLYLLDMRSQDNKIQRYQAKVEKDKEKVETLMAQIAEQGVPVDRKKRFTIAVYDGSRFFDSMNDIPKFKTIISAIDKEINNKSLYTCKVTDELFLKQILIDINTQLNHQPGKENEMDKSEETEKIASINYPDVYLFVEVVKKNDNKPAQLIMTLADSKGIISTFNEEYNDEAGIFNQAPEFTRNLLKKINTYNAPEARITGKNKSNIQLDIGSDYGLKIKQTFILIDNPKQITITISSVTDYTSTAKVYSHADQLKEGDVIELMLFNQE